MAVNIQFRRGIASLWTSVNPTLAEAEWGYEQDTGRFKFGNGIDDWNTLPYSQALSVKTQVHATSDYTAIGSDNQIAADSTGPLNITLNVTPDDWDEITVTRINTGSVTVLGSIDGVSSIDLNDAIKSLTFFALGGVYYVK